MWNNTRNYNIITLFGFLVLLVNEGNASVECFKCRGCRQVLPQHIVDCSMETITTTEFPNTDTTPYDDDMYVTETESFDGDIYPMNKIGDLKMLEEYENDEMLLTNQETRFVLYNSQLPGSSQFRTRGLKQYRSDVDDLRCLTAVYQENGEEIIVRDCTTTYADDDEKLSRCRQAIDDEFTGAVTECNICDSDLCNAAVNLNVSFITLSTLLVSIYTFT